MLSTLASLPLLLLRIIHLRRGVGVHLALGRLQLLSAATLLPRTNMVLCSIMEEQNRMFGSIHLIIKGRARQGAARYHGTDLATHLECSTCVNQSMSK